MKTFVSIVSALFIAWSYYFFCPTLNPGHFDGFLFLGIYLTIIAFNVGMWTRKRWDRALNWGAIGLTITSVCLVEGCIFGNTWFLIFGIFLTILAFNVGKWIRKHRNRVSKLGAVGLAITGVCFFVGCIIGSIWFNTSITRVQLGKVEKVEYDDMIKQIDTSQIPIVDEGIARKQADKKIGEDVALGSRVNLGKGNVQNVDGEIMWVFPLEHSGLFKWSEYHSTPGYITVSASNPNKVKYVSKVGNDSISIRYSNKAWFGDNLARYLRFHGYMTTGLTEYTFEINNEGKPYWVVTTYKNRTLWGNGEATGVAVVDAQTGEITKYDLNNIPDWVDIVQPESFINRQINNWGRLVHGAFNFSGKDKTQKTDLILTVYVNGQCYYFTGMTSVGSDNSCVGFIMVNTRTKKTQMCYLSGATEPAAMKSAEGLVEDFGYKATEPLPLNVNGIPTYVVALKDKEGLIKSYAMVNIANYSIASNGKSLQETSRNYVQAVARNSGTYVVGSNETYGYSLEGKVQRISSVVQDGSTYFYLMMEGENKIFMAPYTVSDELSITREGDTVKVSYLDDKNGTVDVVEFDNITFAVQVSEEQGIRNEMDEGTSAIDDEYSKIIQVNPELNEDTWNSLSDEEKAELLKKYFGN